MHHVKAVGALRALCRLGLPAEQFMPALLEALHDVVPSHRNLFDWTDEQTRLVRYFFEGPLDAKIAQHYFDEFHNRREIEAMLPFAALIELPSGVRAAHEIEHPRFYGSALYHEIWRPQGLHTRLEAVLRGPGGHLLGSLVLYRGPGDPSFTRRDEDRLAAVLPDIAAAVLACGRAATDEPHLPAPGACETLLLTADGRVCHTSAGAHSLLLLADGGVSRDRLSRPLHDLVGGLLRLLLVRLARAHPQHGAAAVATMLQSTDSGPLRASATRLAPLDGGQPLVHVALQRLEPHRVALHRALTRLALPPGQAAVCRELYHGRSHAEIAQRLGIAPATVVDHVRKVYGTLNVRSALELRAVLDSRMGA